MEWRGLHSPRFFEVAGRSASHCYESLYWLSLGTVSADERARGFKIDAKLPLPYRSLQGNSLQVQTPSELGDLRSGDGGDWVPHRKNWNKPREE